MIKLISSQKWQGEGRAFGSAANPIKKLVLLLSTDGSTPSDYTDVDGLDECSFAPGSLLIDIDGGTKYIYDGTQWTSYS